MMTKEKDKKTKTLIAAKTSKEILSNKEYDLTLADLKRHIQECQIRAATAANQELIKL
jgi:hypothetical protein